MRGKGKKAKATLFFPHGQTDGCVRTGWTDGQGRTDGPARAVAADAAKANRPARRDARKLGNVAPERIYIPTPAQLRSRPRDYAARFTRYSPRTSDRFRTFLAHHRLSRNCRLTTMPLWFFLRLRMWETREKLRKDTRSLPRPAVM